MKKVGETDRSLLSMKFPSVGQRIVLIEHALQRGIDFTLFDASMIDDDDHGAHRPWNIFHYIVVIKIEIKI